MTRARVLLAALALLAALVAGGFAGWGLRHARTSTPATTPQPAQHRRVAMFGDSLSYGSGLDVPQDLPNVLGRLRPDLDVIDLAVGGSSTNDLLSRVRSVRLLHPDAVLLWVGGQDSDDKVPISTYTSNLEKLLRELAPARVVLVTPIPDYSVGVTQFAPYAAAVLEVGRAHGARVVDLGTPSQSQYQEDAIHLDAANEARVARLFAAAL